jgi:hypothetical protein
MAAGGENRTNYLKIFLGGKKWGTSALTCVLSPRERILPVHDFGSAEDSFSDPGADIFPDAETMAPSPWGEGWDEGGSLLKSLALAPGWLRPTGAGRGGTISPGRRRTFFSAGGAESL